VQRLFFDFVYCEDTSLLTTFVAEYKFLDKLVDEFEDHMEKLRKIETPNIKPPQNTRFEKVMIEERQYLGHVFLIADKLRKVAALIPELYHLIDNHLRWKELTDGIWSEMQELQKRKMC
jgi:RNA-binding protein YlmH